MLTDPHKGPHPSGIPVDASGGPTVDPTKNVLDLVGAAVLRIDDLAELREKLYNEKAAGLRRALANSVEMAQLRAAHAETLRISDLDRLDKTRQVDVLAGTASAAALATAVQTLATTSDRNADTLRNLVNTTAQTAAKQSSDMAATLAAQTDSLVKDINSRIAELQKSSYQGVGKSMVSDPIQAEFIQEMRALVARQASSAGKSEGISASWGVVLAALAAIVMLYNVLSKPAQPDTVTLQLLESIKTLETRIATPAAPQIYMQPAAPGTLVPVPSNPATVPR